MVPTMRKSRIATDSPEELARPMTHYPTGEDVEIYQRLCAHFGVSRQHIIRAGIRALDREVNRKPAK